VVVGYAVGREEDVPEVCEGTDVHCKEASGEESDEYVAGEDPAEGEFAMSLGFLLFGALGGRQFNVVRAIVWIVVCGDG
jgi:hypothetical protein